MLERSNKLVSGEGNPNARAMLVGEQPGDREDIQGRPFVGPAGKLLYKALDEAGVDRDDVYVTNVIKHFYWEPRGKRRIHKKPNSLAIMADRHLLDAEIERIQPQIIVCLGATAAQALLGRQFRVSTERGKFVKSPLAPYVMATVHPSSLLRMTDSDTRRMEMKKFVRDLKRINEALRRGRLDRARAS
jgi:DNA polymerase